MSDVYKGEGGGTVTEEPVETAIWTKPQIVC